ncbi:hypothetical protein EBU91_00450 [bacterium]|nr:hypothetical protein [bacterium]
MRIDNFSQFSANLILENFSNQFLVDVELNEAISGGDLENTLRKIKVLCKDKGVDFDMICRHLKIREDEIPESIKKMNLSSDAIKFLDNQPSRWRQNTNGEISMYGEFRLKQSDVLLSKNEDGIPYDLELDTVDGPLKVSSENFSNFEGFPKKAFTIELKSCTGVTSLQGCTPDVTNVFDCSGTSISNLTGGPKNIVTKYIVNNCPNLTSLEGAPEEVVEFECLNNPNLKNLVGSPRKVREFRCDESIDSFSGCPEEVTRSFECKNNNKLQTLVSLQKNLKKISPYTRFSFDKCANLFSLEGIPLSTKENLISLTGNFYPRVVMIDCLRYAKEWGNWPCAYLNLLTDTKWKRLSAVQKQVLRDLLEEPSYLKGKMKELSKIYKSHVWEDKAVVSLIQKIGLKEKDFKNLDDYSLLDDMGI